jgi:hypothetical protein
MKEQAEPPSGRAAVTSRSSPAGVRAGVRRRSQCEGWAAGPVWPGAALPRSPACVCAQGCAGNSAGAGTALPTGWARASTWASSEAGGAPSAAAKKGGLD